MKYRRESMRGWDVQYAPLDREPLVLSAQRRVPYGMAGRVTVEYHDPMDHVFVRFENGVGAKVISTDLERIFLRPDGSRI